jgi:hypothetical protein
MGADDAGMPGCECQLLPAGGYCVTAALGLT